MSLHFLSSFLFLSLFISYSTQCGSSSGGPTNVPTADFYGKGSYPWVETLVNWSCVYNVNDFPGSSAAQKFLAAQTAAVKDGGGVVYFPSGTYVFSNYLDIQSNIVIRGAPTGNQVAKSGTNPGNLDPTTHFIFPDREHFGIRNLDPQAKNIGVVNIYSDGGAVMFWPGLQGGPSQWNIKSYWWYATTVVGQGSNKLVFGNKFQHVSYKYPNPENINLTPNEIPWSFSSPIAVYSDQNALVANNLVAKATRVTKVTYNIEGRGRSYPPIEGTFDYPYDNHYGIDVNQILLGGVAGKVQSSGSCGNTGYGVLNPRCFPWGYRRGLTIRDNYVYQNGRVGIAWSGDGDGKTRGSGTQVYNNHVEVAAGTTLYSLNGLIVPTGSDTNENRGYNQQGYASNLTANTGHINRQKIGLSIYLTVDGEGILQQGVGGGIGLLNLWQNNNLSGGSSGYIAFYNLLEVTDNDLFYNTVNPDQHIGALNQKGPVSGNVCRGNSPPCSGL